MNAADLARSGRSHAELCPHLRVVLGGCGASVVCHEHGASPWAESEIRGEAARSRDPPGTELQRVVVGLMVVQHCHRLLLLLLGLGFSGCVYQKKPKQLNILCFSHFRAMSDGFSVSIHVFKNCGARCCSTALKGGLLVGWGPG